MFEFTIMEENFIILQVNLKRWHAESQVYVGAFQYLLQKQKITDQNRNEGNDKSMELQQLMILAKNLLCEIETAINNTRQMMPIVLGRKSMDHRLTFRNNNSNRFENQDVDDLDSKFTKVRFYEYLHNMLYVMRRPGKKNLRQRKKKRNQLKGNRLTTIGDRNGINKDDHHDNGAIVASLWSAESQQPNTLSGPRDRFKKRNHLGRHHHQNKSLRRSRNNSNAKLSDFNSTIQNQKPNAIGAKQLRNNQPRRNNGNKNRREYSLLQNVSRKRLHRRRTTVKTTDSTKSPVSFIQIFD